jgi:hypothetical protein
MHVFLHQGLNLFFDNHTKYCLHVTNQDKSLNVTAFINVQLKQGLIQVSKPQIKPQSSP